jgi:magnesium chelatase family protein
MARRRYFGRLSGPLLDRVDLHVDVRAVRRGTDDQGESSSGVAARVAAARQAAGARFAGLGWRSNAAASPAWLREHTPRPVVAVGLRSLDSGALTARGLDRSFRVAWTLADLAGKSSPGVEQFHQAMVLRTRASVMGAAA